MDFIDRIRELAARIPKQLEYCHTEEATKNALIMPFINALGYDVFNPREVVPEFTADFGTKKGEKVDYAIFQNGKPIMLFECKSAGADLGKIHASQLYRYFSVVPEVRFGILTNGVQYQFYSDLEATNRMDDRPFFTFNMVGFGDRQIDELKKFTKSTFDLDEILTTASELKYTAAIRNILDNEFEQPSDEFVVLFARQVYSGRLTQAAKDQFKEIVQKALRRFLNDKINERLKSALETNGRLESTPDEVPQTESETQEPLDSADKSERTKGIVTTEDEIEGFFAVKSILRDKINAKRVHMRDTKSYCGILLDDNNRRPVCRLHFNREQKYVGLFDSDAGEERIPIGDIDDIYQYASRIIATVEKYESSALPVAAASNTSKGTILQEKSDFTGKSLLAVHFHGDRYQVTTWKEGLLTVVALLRKERPELFEIAAPKMTGKLRPYITSNESELRSSTRISGTKYYVEVNLRSTSIVRLCYRLLKEMGYSQRDLAFEAG